MGEHRGSDRVRTRRKVALVLSDGTVMGLWTTELSRRGLQVLSPYTTDLGAEFTVRFRVLDAEIDDYAPVEMRVRVVHLIYSDSGREGSFRIQMQALSFSEHSEQRYLQYLAGQLRKRQQMNW